jgi:hypothetical protein
VRDHNLMESTQSRRQPQPAPSPACRLEYARSSLRQTHATPSRLCRVQGAGFRTLDSGVQDAECSI